ncbi:MAG: hypothetical protein U5K54_22740 [Cytophagales bacterium]|nr:hypothetical protein [Cytophagales bacterium]
METETHITQDLVLGLVVLMWVFLVATKPYVLSGIPPIPNIYSLVAPNVGEKNTGLPIEIKVKSNN